jgi:hypothetical protein
VLCYPLCTLEHGRATRALLGLASSAWGCLQPANDQKLRLALEGAFGPAIPVKDGEVGAVWSIGEVELCLSIRLPSRRMRAAWRRRQARRK